MTLIRDCLAKGIESTKICMQKLPPADAHVLAPYVSLTMKLSGVVITVGNRSSPDNGNHAVIKSFEFGYTERPVARMTIHDEQGSSFVKFMEDLLKEFKCTTKEGFNQATIEFGWIKLNCQNQVALDRSPKFLMMLRDITCQFDGGKLMYNLELTDLMDVHAEGRVDKIYGGEGDKAIHITDAITQLLTDSTIAPSVAAVEFLKLNSKGDGTSPITWADADEDPKKGPKGKFVCNNLDKLNCVMGWLSSYVTTDDKSFIISYDATYEGGKIIIWEDPKPGCNESVSLESCIGLYIVNGGKQSPVISFNPRFKFTFVNLASSGGTAGTKFVDSEPGDQSKNPGHDCESLNRKNSAGGGAQNTTAAKPNQQDQHNKNADQKTRKGQNKQLLAYFDAATTEPIEADLVVVGDPSLPRPLLTKFRPIHIIFINPFHLFPRGDGNACGDWLAAPFCNEVLTNKAWRVKGVTHQISEGKFTTTINVTLPAPGVHLNVGQPFGGSGSGGWVPPAACAQPE